MWRRRLGSYLTVKKEETENMHKNGRSRRRSFTNSLFAPSGPERPGDVRLGPTAAERRPVFWRPCKCSSFKNRRDTDGTEVKRLSATCSVQFSVSIFYMEYRSQPWGMEKGTIANATAPMYKKVYLFGRFTDASVHMLSPLA